LLPANDFAGDRVEPRPQGLEIARNLATIPTSSSVTS